MKRSAQVTLTLVSAAVLAGCGRRKPADPCEKDSYSDVACQEAVRSHGYHWHGTWIPRSYSFSHPHYYEQYRSHVMHGGAVHVSPASSYARPAVSSTPTHTQRGGFGAIGASHATGGLS